MYIYTIFLKTSLSIYILRSFLLFVLYIFFSKYENNLFLSMIFKHIYFKINQGHRSEMLHILSLF